MVRPAVLLLLAAGCSEYDLNRGQDGTNKSPEDSGWPDTLDSGEAEVPADCDPAAWPAEQVGVDDSCVAEPEVGFTPIVEWEYSAGSLAGCLSLPVVGDLDGDGQPEVVVNVTDLFSSAGTLTVLHGDGSGVLWSDSGASLGYASSPALADLDGDGSAEVLAVREHSSCMWWGEGEYSVVAWSATGEELWESEHFDCDDFDYATGLAVSDMDHDGSPEIVAGRVVLGADGSTRGTGTRGKGSYGASEVALPAIADVDLDGTEEVIVGDALYSPDGELLLSMVDDDAMVAVANLDEDPEGEWIAISGDTIRAVDTDGQLLWGPQQVDASASLSVASIGDLDLDGWPEIAIAGRDTLVVANHDGSLLWTASVHDETGATGTTIFDFEGDGFPELVHMDEMQVAVYDGRSGEMKFNTTEHSSNTMFEYPIIADVDGDDQAEIVVCHNGYSSVVSVYGDQDNSWAPARKVWNQHAYAISQVNDDLSVPQDAEPAFSTHNTFRSALATDGGALAADLQGEILEVCTDDCDAGLLWVSFRLLNKGLEAVDAGASMALYARDDAGGSWLVETVETADAVDSGWSSEGFALQLEAEAVQGADSLWLEVDDDGTGTGALDECSEANNGFAYDGPLCE